jgi:hypothetical protein
VKTLDVRFDGAKRDDLQAEHRFAIPPSPHTDFAKQKTPDHSMIRGFT